MLLSNDRPYRQSPALYVDVVKGCNCLSPSRVCLVFVLSQGSGEDLVSLDSYPSVKIILGFATFGLGLTAFVYGDIS
jgi:hypothetical protein